MDPIDIDENRSSPASQTSQRKMIAIVVAAAIGLIALVAMNMK